jgi:hypothetical protein
LSLGGDIPAHRGTPYFDRRNYPAATVIFSARHFWRAPLMTKDLKTASDIARMIKEKANLSLGPWPRDLQLFIFDTKSGWKCGLSPATQASDSEYREAVLQIARELQSTVSLVRSPDASQEGG